MSEESAQGKREWPELVFIKFSIAAAIIEKENPNVKAIKILAGTPRILNLDETRVWVDVNIEDIAVETPKVG